ncbi:hypothetical protein M9H77_23935 [Catharanthus roseus]|uniref:Uncharacterized protein n=1 Tax=Catharanthus roseus TaxID=4058 RepID=A0ACC0AVX7_CATRO|nr:hypothetical protein M9H77_23935 [Catharanthus roseus]
MSLCDKGKDDEIPAIEEIICADKVDGMVIDDELSNEGNISMKQPKKTEILTHELENPVVGVENPSLVDKQPSHPFEIPAEELGKENQHLDIPSQIVVYKEDVEGQVNYESSDDGDGFLDSNFELNDDDNELIDVFVEDGVRHFDVNFVNEAQYMVQDKREDCCMVQIERGKKGGVRDGIKGPHKKCLESNLADDFVGNVRMKDVVCEEDNDIDDSYHLFVDSHPSFDEEELSSRSRYINANKVQQGLDPQFKIGITFKNSNELKVAIANHGITNGKEVKFKKNDALRLQWHQLRLGNIWEKDS